MGVPREFRKCRRCGGPVEGKDLFCGRCAGKSPAPAGPPDSGAGPDPAPPDGFVCPYCRAELSWSSLGFVETEVTIYVQEKIYFCPRCRAFLGVSSWHTEG